MAYDRLSGSIRERLCCPACHSSLHAQDSELTCTGPGCGRTYPVVDGIPVLIDDSRSVFSTGDFVRRRNTTFHLTPSRRERAFARMLDLIPSFDAPRQSARNYARLADALLSTDPNPKVLVIGGSIQGEGMEAIVGNPSIALIPSDVSFGPFTALICDAHDIPFDDGTFDGVIVQAVLEHVADPIRCVDEIHRVLKNDGLVYAETPFMQQVHMGPYDFTRFTHSGHRRLFRHFSEVASGPVAGPGVALAWSYQYFLLSFATSRPMRGILRAVAGFTSFFLKYMDDWVIDRPGAVDAASGFYFLGRKQSAVLGDRDLISYYKGALST